MRRSAFLSMLTAFTMAVTMILSPISAQAAGTQAGRESLPEYDSKNLEKVIPEIRTTPLQDDFDGDSLNGEDWLVAWKSWGGLNNGVIPENVSVSDGSLKLEGHGDLYSGDVAGSNKDLPFGARAGAAIATRDYYASGKYEVVAKVAPELGACSAMWTFMYQDDTGIKYNSEIDIEMPTANDTHDEPSFECARFNTYVTEGLHNSQFLDTPTLQNDGQWHKYTIDWHTGDEDTDPYVDFYVDDTFITRSSKNVPTDAARFWIGIWFPWSEEHDVGWAGTPNFDTTVFEIDSVTITPYGEEGDTADYETAPKSGWANDSFPEDIAAESYDHIVNGDFAIDDYGWTCEADAQVTGGKGYLKASKSVNTLKQNVTVKPRMTYTFSADVETDGMEVTVGVRKLNGTECVSKTVTESGRVDITFTTTSGCEDMQVFLQTERYASSKPDAYVTAASLRSGSSSAIDDTEGGDIDQDDSDVDSDNPDIDPTDPDDQDSGEDIGDTDSDQDTDEDTGDIDSDQDTGSDTESGQSDTGSSVKNLITNGDFYAGSLAWELHGSAEVTDGEDGAAWLASGADTDSIEQTLELQPDTTYTLYGDVRSDGSEVSVGVKNCYGRYTDESVTMSTSGKAKVTFTTASDVKTVKVYAQVLRYQANKEQVKVDNLILLQGDGSEEIGSGDSGSDSEDVESGDIDAGSEETGSGETAQEDSAVELLQNPSFEEGSDGWKLSGSARIEDGSAILASGSDTDTVKQTLTVEPETSYVFRADFVSSGAELTMAVSDYNGKYTKLSEEYSSSGSGEISFTIGKNVKEITVTLQVLRYQSNKEDVIVSAASLKKVN